MQTNQRTQDPIQQLDLENYLWKLADREPRKWRPQRLHLAAREYRRLLELRREHQDNLAPTEMMDAVWHEHILDTRQYVEDTHRIFGRFIHHCPRFPADLDQDDAAGRRTLQLYEERYGEAPAEVAMARCAGKACHAPTPCDCR